MSSDLSGRSPVRASDALSSGSHLPPLASQAKKHLVGTGKFVPIIPRASFDVERPLEVIIADLCENDPRYAKGVTPKQLLDHVMAMPEKQRPFRDKRHLQVQLSRKVGQQKIKRHECGGVYSTTSEIINKRRELMGNRTNFAEDLPDVKAEIKEELLESPPPPPQQQQQRPTVAVRQTPQQVIVSQTAVQTNSAEPKRPGRKRKNRSLDGGATDLASEGGGGSENKKRAAIATSATTTEVDPPKCDFCLLGESLNRKGSAEAMLCCANCQSYAHPSCLGYSQQLAERCHRTLWHCFECKACRVCHSSSDTEHILLCDGCDVGQHMQCCRPPIKVKPTHSWHCVDCRPALSKASTVAGPKATTTSPSAKQQAAAAKKPSPGGAAKQPPAKAAKPTTTTAASPGAKQQPPAKPVSKAKPPAIDTSTPVEQPAGATVPKPTPPATSGATWATADCHCEKRAASFVCDRTADARLRQAAAHATDWTVAQVAQFVRHEASADEAEVFERQCMDGTALLLLQRHDIVHSMGLRLGPALKLHAVICSLQAIVAEADT